MKPVERDKEIFVRVKEKKVLNLMWESINSITPPFKDQTNHFIYPVDNQAVTK